MDLDDRAHLADRDARDDGDGLDDRAARRDGLADHLRHLAAREFAGASPLYERIASALAEDEEALDLVVDLAPAEKVVPVLLNAAVHAQVLADPSLPLARLYRGEDAGDPWPAWRAHVLAHLDELGALMARRAIQTNEVGRTATLVPALRLVHEQLGRPLALVEVGTSAGLNLQLDRFGYRWDDGPVVGDPDSPVQLRCRLVGPHHPPIGPPPPIGWRIGIDRDPIDVLDDEAVQWLRACVWPGLEHRAERLAAAVEVARRSVPAIRRGDLLELLPGVLAEVPDDLTPVVLSTWVLAYLARPDRQRVVEELDAIGADRALACVTVEYPGVAPWVPVPARPPLADAGQGGSMLGLTTWEGGHRQSRALAWVQAHGDWIEWHDPSGRST